MIGKTISHYRILAKLGAGGMGDVYEAEDIHLGRRVALKFLHSGQDVAVLLREARAASTLNHANICQIYEVDPENGFLAMELVEGSTLKALIGNRPLPLADAVRLALEIGEGLNAAHAAGIIHRDIKPGNVLVTSEGHAKVTDFGLAKRLQPSGLTGETTTSGTLGYMAPEQTAGGQVDTRSDIWSFGAVLHEMLTGRLPGGQTETLPEGLGRLVRKALAGDPAERYQHISDLLVDLRQWRSPTPRYSRRWLLAGAGTAAAAVGGAVWLAPRLAGKSYSSLAVLPLENLSGDAEQEWFSDGMTDTLIAELSKIRALRVISRTSVMQYKKQPKPLKAIASELDVQVVVEGSALRAGDRTRITASLIDAATDRRLWTDQYDRETGDVLSLHREIARRIAREVRAAVTAGEERLLAPGRKAKPEAIEAYLKAVHLRNQGPQHLPEQLKLAREAVRLDPDYALGHYMVARSLQSLGDYARMPYAEVIPEMRMEIKKALDLDPDLAIAHGLLAWSLMTVEHDWDGAEEAAKRAADGRVDSVLLVRGKLTEALEVRKRAASADPLNPATLTDVARNFAALGRFDEAIAWHRKALAVAPDNAYALSQYTFSLLVSGRTDEAVEPFLRTRPQQHRERLRAAYNKGGWPMAFRAWIELSSDPSDPRYSKQNQARAEMLGGIFLKDFDLAMKGLETLEQINDSFLAQLWDAVFHPVRQEPRFKAVLKRLRYPESMWQ